MDLQDAELYAKRLISLFGSPWMLSDDEAIGEIITTIYWAKYKYDPARGAESTYVITCVKNKIYKLYRDRNKHYFKNRTCGSLSSISRSQAINIPLNEEIEMCGLSPTELKYTIAMMDNSTQADLSRKFGVSKQRVNAVIKNALNKMKRNKHVFQQ